METRRRILVALDFDHTVSDENTDYYVLKLSPEDDLPDYIKKLYSDHNWIDYMREVFKYFHAHGITKEAILDCMTEIPLAEGMKELFQLKRENLLIDFIIISDSNSVFISHILDTAGLLECICQIFTNPAEFDSSGCLQLQGYHKQDYCTLSSDNLCKGNILQKFISEKQNSDINYSSILYVGDGYNDLCPGLTLSEGHFLLPRIGFSLQRTLERMSSQNKQSNKNQVKATVVPWSTGFDVIKCIDTWLSSHK